MGKVKTHKASAKNSAAAQMSLSLSGLKTGVVSVVAVSHLYLT